MQLVSIERRPWLVAIGIALVLLGIVGSLERRADFLVTAIGIVAVMAAVLTLIQALPRRRPT